MVNLIKMNLMSYNKILIKIKIYKNILKMNKNILIWWNIINMIVYVY